MLATLNKDVVYRAVIRNTRAFAVVMMILFLGIVIKYNICSYKTRLLFLYLIGYLKHDMLDIFV